MSKRILFFGNERLATGLTTTAPTLRALIEAGYEIAAVVVAQHDQGKSRQPRQLEIVEVAERHGIPVLSPDNPAESLDTLKEYEAELGVLVAYGKIMPQSVMDIFPRGIVNIHPSLLPKHRGSTPIESVILAGETQTGVSVMELSARMDAGPVYAQEKVIIEDGISKQDLADKLLNKGAELLVKSLPAIIEGTLAPVEQDESAATTDRQITKQDGIIDWQKPAAQLEREVRAYLHWPRSRTQLGGTDVVITQCHVSAGTAEPDVTTVIDNLPAVGTSEGFVVIDRLVPAGKKEMDGKAFLAGYRL
jgi:methionyl-tRNA formyltransferase